MTDLTKTRPETEMHLLGCVLIDQRTIAGVVDILGHDDFSDRDIGAGFRAAVDLWRSGHDATPTAVAADLPAEAADLVWSAYESIGSAVGATWYAHKIKEASTRREIISRCKQIAKMAASDPSDIEEIISSAQARMYEIQHKDVETTITEDLIEIQRMSSEAAESKYGTIGVPTGFQRLDDVTGGLRKQDLITVAARPSIGKTAIATNIFQNIVENTDGIKAMFFSGEMSRHQLLLRMASRRCGIDNNALARGNLRPNEWTGYTTACGELAKIMEDRLWIDDKSRPSPGHIRAIAKQKQQAFGLDIIFVDYLNIMSAPGKYAGKVEELSAITGGMKSIAKDLNIPVVLLAQVSRGAENRTEIYEPGLGDLKGSGSIEEDSDIVLFVHRSDRSAAVGKLIVGKHRNGPLVSIPLRYDGAITTFKEI